MREHHFSYCETVRKYNLESTRIGGAIQMLQRWERKYLEEDLIAENQRLRMELEYLKKLSALVLAEEQKNGKKRENFS